MRSEAIKGSWADSHSCAIAVLGPSAITRVLWIRRLQSVGWNLLLRMIMAESPSTFQTWNITLPPLTMNAKAMKLISLEMKVDTRRISDDFLSKVWGVPQMLGKGSWWPTCSKNHLREKLQLLKAWIIVKRLQSCLTIGRKVQISLPVQAPTEHLLK